MAAEETAQNGWRRGHAVEAARDAFNALVWQHVDAGERIPMAFSHEGVEYDTEQLVRALWSCTDVMPPLLCESLDMPSGKSYASGARSIRAKLPKKRTKK